MQNILIVVAIIAGAAAILGAVIAWQVDQFSVLEGFIGGGAIGAIVGMVLGLYFGSK